MKIDDPIDRAVTIATRAHEGQVDKAGAPYIEHPLRVMAALEGPEAKVAGVLHDVVEDTPVTLDDLRAEGFSEEVIAAVDALTKRSGEDYERYLSRVTSNHVATQVKIADMTDNMDMSRIPAPTDKDHKRLAKYQKVLPRLQVALQKLESGD